MSDEGGRGAPEADPSAAADPSRLYTARPLLAVSVAVFREGHVLLAERAREPGRGLFALPGGLVEPGESLAEAARRELEEEVGVRARVLGLADVVEVIERDATGRARFHAAVLVHAALWLSGEPREGPEAPRVLWALPADIDGLPTTAGLAGAVARAAAIVTQEGAGWPQSPPVAERARAE